MGLLARLMRAKKKDAWLPFLCSSCYEFRPGEQMRALPWWNTDAGAFFMKYNCPSCFDKSLAETEQRIEHWDADADKEFRSFLEIWNVLKYFPDVQGASIQETAKNVLRLVTESKGKALAVLARVRA